jgi:hypothetical protein
MPKFGLGCKLHDLKCFELEFFSPCILLINNELEGTNKTYCQKKN